MNLLRSPYGSAELFLVVVLALVVIGGGSYYVYGQRQAAQTEQANHAVSRLSPFNGLPSDSSTDAQEEAGDPAILNLLSDTE